MARTDPRPHYGQRIPRTGLNGYVFVWAPDHPLAMRDGYVLEHRMVAWDAGIITDRAQQVHHRNGIRTDNRPENLAAVAQGEHQSAHLAERGTVQNQYGVFPVLKGQARIDRSRQLGRENQRRIRERRKREREAGG